VLEINTANLKLRKSKTNLTPKKAAKTKTCNSQA